MGSATNWVGGEFVWAPSWRSPRDGNKEGNKKQYSYAGKKKHAGYYVFNPNVTACHHPNCQIIARGKEAKKEHQLRMERGFRQIKFYRSHARGNF